MWKPTGISSVLIVAVEIVAASALARIGWELGGRLWLALH